MQFVRFQKENRQNSYGILDNRIVYEIKGSIFKKFKRTDESFQLENVHLLAPCEPTNIYCVGLNFQEHINELEVERPKKPANFCSPVPI